MILLRVCLLGHFPAVIDEGCRRVCAVYRHELATRFDLLAVDLRHLWRQAGPIKAFSPHVVHFIMGPSSFSSLLGLVLVQRVVPNAHVVLSAVQPQIDMLDSYRFWARKALAKVTVLVQSPAAEQAFQALSRRIYFVPNGVYLREFSPGTPGRNIIGVAPGKPVVLHVGACVDGRGVGLMAQLAETCLPVIIGRPSNGQADTARRLRSSGCLVHEDYVAHMPDIYRAAACYLFLVRDGRHCIDTPLSVLEAMATNLPVITTSFGALPTMFGDPVKGLTFMDVDSTTPDALRTCLEAYCAGDFACETRTAVKDYDWSMIFARIEKIYGELVGS